MNKYEINYVGTYIPNIILSENINPSEQLINSYGIN